MFKIFQKKNLIPVFNINGSFDIKNRIYLEKSINNLNPDKIKAILFIVNSKGGSIAQADILGNFMKNYSNKNNIKFYTAIQNNCLNISYYLSTFSNKVY